MSNSFSKLKSEIDKIEIPEDRLQQTIKLGIQKGRIESRNPSKHFIYFSAAAVVAIGLFFGSAVISPTMGKIAAKVPLLGHLFDTRPIGAIIADELLQKGYQISGAGGGTGEINVRIAGTREYFDSIQEDVTTIVQEILDRKGYETYQFELVHINETPIDMPEEWKEAQAESLKVKEALREDFLLFDVYAGYNNNTKHFVVEIPKTETRAKEIEFAANEALQSMVTSKYTLEVRERVFTPIEFVSKLSEILTLEKKLQYKTATFYAFPVQEGKSNHFPDSYEGYEEVAITVYLSIPKSQWNTMESKKIRNEVEEMVREFYHSKEIAPFLSLPLSDIVIDSYENIEEK
ncbi:hypothetical protein ACLM5H_24355 [Fredinandcohnia humi]